MQVFNTLGKALPLFSTLHKANVLKDFFIYSCGSLFVRALSLFVVPFLMRTLTPSDYGALALVTAFITIGTAVIGLGLRQFLSIEYFHHDARGQKKLINELLVIYTSCALVLLFATWQIKHLILISVFFNAVSSDTLLGACIALFLFFYAELLYQILQYERQSKQLILLQISGALITLLCTFWTVWILKWGVTGVVWAQAMGHIYASAIGLYVYHLHEYSAYRNVRIALQKTIAYVKQGAPFVPGIMSSWILASADRWMLGYYYSTHEVGIYAVADLFAQLFNALVLVPWAGSYLPYILQKYKQNPDSIESIERHNQRIMWISLCIASIVITMGYIICKPLIFWLLPATYHEAWRYVWVLLIGQVFLLGSYFASALIQFKKKTYFLAFALFLPALLNIFLNYLFIQSLSIFGCALATFISYLTYFALTWWYNKNLFQTRNVIRNTEKNHATQ